jgi:hypothetical protein
VASPERGKRYSYKRIYKNTYAFLCSWGWPSRFDKDFPTAEDRSKVEKLLGELRDLYARRLGYKAGEAPHNVMQMSKEELEEFWSKEHFSKKPEPLMLLGLFRDYQFHSLADTPSMRAKEAKDQLMEEYPGVYRTRHTLEKDLRNAKKKHPREWRDLSKSLSSIPKGNRLDHLQKKFPDLWPVLVMMLSEKQREALTKKYGRSA